MIDHDRLDADARTFGQRQVDVANRIANYVATNTDAHNWGPQRWAYEAVMVILGDEGAAWEVLRCMEGQTVVDLAVIPVGSVPPWMEPATRTSRHGRIHVDSTLELMGADGAVRPLYVMREDSADTPALHPEGES